VEIFIIKTTDWLQTLYFGIGTLILILVFLRFRVREKG
jgi:hypothetical protein